MLHRLPATAVAMGLAWALSLFCALGDLPRFPRHEQHLFLAEHFARQWWSASDARWYGGLDVATHPPGVAQLVALCARVPGLTLERAYAVVAVGAAVLVAFGLSWLARALGGGKGWWAVSAVAMPPLWLALVPWGEVPGVASVGLGLVAAATSLEPRRDPVFGLTSALAAGAAATCHPIGLAVALGAMVKPRRGMLAFLGACVGIAACWPFYRQLLAFERPDTSSLHTPLVVAAAVAACMAVIALVQRQTTAAALAILSGLLPLTGLLGAPFAGAGTWLLGSTALTGAVAASLETRPRRWAMVPAAAAVVCTAVVLGQAHQVDLRPSRAALKEVEGLLRQPSEAKVRWLALGVGPEWLELSRRLTPASIDGGFGWLGPSLDSIEPTAEGLSRLRAALQKQYAVKWVVTRDARFDEALAQHEFRVTSAWRGGVRLWVRDEMSALVEHPPSTRVGFGFGVVAPSLVGLALIAVALAFLAGHKLADRAHRRA